MKANRIALNTVFCLARCYRAGFAGVNACQSTTRNT